MSKHHSHSDIVLRLKRANGHLAKIIAMIEEERSCLDVAQQLQAVYSAVGNAKQAFVQDHIEGCIEHEHDESPSEIKAKIRELKDIAKYL